MMEKIHAAANHVVVKIIFALIIIGFMITGIGFTGFFSGSSGSDRLRYIAEVNGEGLSRAAFENQVRQLSQQIAPNANEAVQQLLRQRVLNEQIDQLLLEQYADKLKLKISNQQVINAIRQQTVFFQDGKFNNDLYLQLLKANGFTPDSYAESVRKSLKTEQLMGAIVGTEFVLPVDSEIDKLQNQQRTVELATLPASSVVIDDKAITPELMQQYYQQHQSAFTHKERVKLSYIANSMEQIVKTTPKPTKPELQAYLKAHQDQYQFPAKQQYSVITVSDQAEADKIYAELQNGKDFNQLANEIAKHAEVGAANGNLGWFNLDKSLPAFLSEAKLSQVGSYSKPIAYQNNYVLVHLTASKPAQAMPLDYVADQLSAKLFKARCEAIYAANNQKLEQAMAQQPESLQAVAKATGLPVVNLDWVNEDDTASILRFPEIHDRVFSDEMIQDNKPNPQLSDLIKTADYQAGFVVQVTDYQPQGVTPFETAKASIQQQLKAQLQQQKFAQKLTEITQQVQQTGTAQGISFAQPIEVKADNTKLDQRTLAMIFSLAPSEQSKYTVGSVIKPNGDAVIAKLLQFKPGEQTDLTEALQPLYQQNSYVNLLNTLQQQAKIELFTDDKM